MFSWFKATVASVVRNGSMVPLPVSLYITKFQISHAISCNLLNSSLVLAWAKFAVYQICIEDTKEMQSIPISNLANQTCPYGLKYMKQMNLVIFKCLGWKLKGAVWDVCLSHSYKFTFFFVLLEACSRNLGFRDWWNLQDKWKTLVHTARISPQQRRGEPVPQDLLDRVLDAHAYWSQQAAKQQLKQQSETCLLFW